MGFVPVVGTAFLIGLTIGAVFGVSASAFVGLAVAVGLMIVELPSSGLGLALVLVGIPLAGWLVGARLGPQTRRTIRRRLRQRRRAAKMAPRSRSAR